jgi:hypothetical protein
MLVPLGGERRRQSRLAGAEILARFSGIVKA